MNVHEQQREECFCKGLENTSNGGIKPTKGYTARTQLVRGAGVLRAYKRPHIYIGNRNFKSYQQTGCKMESKRLRIEKAREEYKEEYRAERK